MANLPARVLRLAVACLVTGALLLPAAAPVGAAAPEDKILRVGTMQDLDSMNPWNTALTTGFEVFNLNYEFLVGFGSDLEPVPGFAESWSRVDNGDGTFTWTFKIPEGKTWSDGTPATAEDARWTLQFVLDAVTAGNYVGLGYLDPDLTNAGVTKVEAPDATTLVVTNTDPSDRILQMYIPMLPKHIWQDQTLETIPTFANEAPVVGSGPYQAVEWKTGEFVRLVRNPTYQWTQGAADEVVIQFFKTGDTMVQGLKTGDLDYAHGINSDQFDSLKGQPGIVTVNGVTNGWTMLNLNSYDKDIPGGGASTKALRDPAFRDALGYAIDKELLIDASWVATGPRDAPRCRRSPRSGTSSRTSRARSTSTWRNRSSMRRATRLTPRENGWTRRASRSPFGSTCRRIRRTTRSPRRSSRSGSASSASTSSRPSSTRRPSSKRSCRPRRATATRPIGT